MSVKPPPFHRVLPDDIGAYGFDGACVLALVRYVTALTGERNGRRLVDGEMWWQASHAEIGTVLGGGNRQSVGRAIRRLESDKALLSRFPDAVDGDQTKAYRVPDDEPEKAADQQCSFSHTGADQQCSDLNRYPTSNVQNRTGTCSNLNTPLFKNELSSSSVKELNKEGERSARGREPDEPLDVTAVPEPANALSPQSLLDENNIIDGELVDEPEDPEPPEYCAAHMPYGTSESCRGCKTARINHEAWTRRQNEGALLEILRDRETTSQAEAAKPRHRCNYCRDGGIVLNGDGTPGSQRRICHHDGFWHIATPEELAELGLT